MKITDTDGQGRLFSVTDILPADLLAELLSVDFSSVRFGRQPGQETWPRRLLDSSYPVLTKVNEYIWQLHSEIEQQCSISVLYPHTSWWLDEPGFTVSLHTDGHLPMSMQLFWIMPTLQHGTAFYHSKREDDVRFAPEGLVNTGYIMLNGLNEDGSQPLHWHGMLTPVPEGTVRLTSYSVFGRYENK